MRILNSSSVEPAFNSALEEFFYKNRAGEDSLLLLYRNAPCVMFGRNQNPWMEADTVWCHENGLPVVRRISGGGAVYHDLGNLNYAFLAPRKDYSPDIFVGVILNALRKTGIEAEIRGQHSIWANGCKIAGNAFALNGRTALIHGCLLVNANLDALSASLKADKDKVFQCASIPSVRAPVTNISSIVPGLDMATVAMSIVDETMEKWQVSQEDDSQTIEQIAALPDFQELVDKYHGTQWNMNRTPDFRLTWSLPLAVFTLQVSKGIVTEAMAGDQQIPELIQMPFDTVLPILAKREP